MRSSFAIWGWGAARRTVMPRALARRCVLISTASPATSQKDTPVKSMMSSRAPGLSTPSRRWRSAGAATMSRSPSSLTIVNAGRLTTDRLASAETLAGALAASTAFLISRSSAPQAALIHMPSKRHPRP